MTLIQLVILSIIQGLSELLPVSSSAHVIAAEKLMGLDPSAPALTLLLVMLHTGTMFAVIVYFWRSWKRAFFSSTGNFVRFLNRIIIATVITGVIGFGLKLGIEKYLQHQNPAAGKADIEQIFSNLLLMSASLLAAGILILWSGLASRRRNGHDRITLGDSVKIGGIQSLCLPFRGFSRSGATISVGLLNGLERIRAEEFSFALAIVLTPAVVGREALRFVHDKGQAAAAPVTLHDCLLGMLFSFLAGLVALKLLSRLLERGKWWVFGIYCLVASGAVYWLYLKGY
ncbi:MAG TPA: undecaprenyl-diphosphate phosphatase [Tepidisphaeraceae bacterium]|jgi:undecaprenyl-diphosphatase